ncbi:MAG: DUF2079 domain-containing protein [bacterium]
MRYVGSYFVQPLTVAWVLSVAAAAIAVGFLTAAWLRRGGWEKLRRLEPGAVVWAVAALYFLIFAAATIGRHYAMATTFDLAYHANLVYQCSRGHLFQQTVDPTLGGVMRQLSFTLVALAPFGASCPSPCYLLITQTLSQAAAALIIFAIARTEEGPRWPAAALAVSFALSPALHGANLFDFDARALAVPAILGACYFFSRRRFGFGLALALIAALTREDLALYAVGLAAWGGFATGRRKAGLAVALGLGLYFAVVCCVVYPKLTYAGDVGLFESWVFTRHFGMLEAVRGDAGGTQTLLQALGPKSGYLLALLIPVAAFLPFAGSALLIIILPLAVPAATSMEAVYKFGLHYPFGVLPFLYGAAAVGARRLAAQADKWKGLFLTAASTAAVLTQALFIVAFSRSYYGPALSAVIPGPHEKGMAAALKLVPADVAVCTDEPFLPHLARRRYLYFYPLARSAKLPRKPAALLLNRRLYPAAELPAILACAREWGLGLYECTPDFAYFARGPGRRPNEDLFEAWFRAAEDWRCRGPGVRCDVADPRAHDGRAAYVPSSLHLPAAPGYVYPPGEYKFVFFVTPAAKKNLCRVSVKAYALDAVTGEVIARREVVRKAGGGGRYKRVPVRMNIGRRFLFGFDAAATAPFYFDAVSVNSTAFTLASLADAASSAPSAPP